MKTFELPVIYLRNFKEVSEAIEKALPEPEKDEDTQMTMFFIPDQMFIRLNPQSSGKRCTLYFNPIEIYTIDLDYETARITLQEIIK